ncbi:MAG: hypothetical protein ACYTXC_04565 [Nostoc sp.]
MDCGLLFVPIRLGEGGGGLSLFLGDVCFESFDLFFGLTDFVADLFLKVGKGRGLVEFWIVFVTKSL